MKKDGVKKNPLRVIDGGKPADSVVSLTSERNKRGNENRRQLERHFTTYWINTFIEMPSSSESETKNELNSVTMSDLSEDGCAFSILEQSVPFFKALQENQQTFRLQLGFSQDTFIVVGFQVANIIQAMDHSTKPYRVGCRLDPSFAATPAYRQFIRFLAAYSGACVTTKAKASSF